MGLVVAGVAVVVVVVLKIVVSGATTPVEVSVTPWVLLPSHEWLSPPSHRSL